MDGRTAEIRALWALDPGPVTQIFIDGKWVVSSISACFRRFGPYAEQVWGSVPEASVEDVGAAARAAHGIGRARSFDKSERRLRHE